MSPTSRLALLAASILALTPPAGAADQPAADGVIAGSTDVSTDAAVAPGDPADHALAQGRALADMGESERAIEAFTRAAVLLVGRPAERVGALAAVAELHEVLGAPRDALDAWLTALPPADGVARAPESDSPDLGIFVRVRIAALLRQQGDLAGAEAMGWEAVAEARELGRFEAASVGVLTVLRSAAVEGDAGVSERVVELDELLAGFDAYRLHSLPRPLPLGWMAHDVARQYAEAGLLDEALPAFAVAARTYHALDALDLGARALVDLARAALELRRPRLAEGALAEARAWDGDAAGKAGVDVLEAELLVVRGEPEAAADRFLALAEAGGGPERAVWLGRAARLRSLSDPEAGIELHRRAAEVARATGQDGEALVEDIFRAELQQRLGRDARPLLRSIEGALGDGAALPLDAQVRLQATWGHEHATRGEAALAGQRFAEAGALFFRAGDVEGAALVGAEYAEFAADADKRLEALANARSIEQMVGLGASGWAAAAAFGRAGEPWEDRDGTQVARERLLRWAWLLGPARAPEPVRDPGEVFAGDLAGARAFARARSVRPPAAWAAAVEDARADIAALVTRPSRGDFDAQREALVEALQHLEVGAPQALPECVLPGPPAGGWVFDGDGAGGARVLGPGGPVAPTRAALNQARRSRGARVTPAAPVLPHPKTRVRWTPVCALPGAWAPAPSGEVVSLSLAPRPLPELLDRALDPDVALQEEALEVPLGAVVLVDRTPTAAWLDRLQAAGAHAVVEGAVDPDTLRAALARQPDLDAALKGQDARIWGDLPE